MRHGVFTVIEADASAKTSNSEDATEAKGSKTLKFLSRSMDVFNKIRTKNGEKPLRLRRGDVCEFTIGIEKRTDLEHAVNIKLLKTNAEYVKEYIASKLKGSNKKEKVYHGIINDLRGRRGSSNNNNNAKDRYSITPVGSLKDDLSFDMYLQNENRVKSKDEVSFSLIDVPLYDGSDKTKKIVCNLRKLKSGTIKLEKVIADNAVGYVVKELRFKSSSTRNGRGDKSRGRMPRYGSGGLLQLEDPSLLVEKNEDGAKSRSKSPSRRKGKIGRTHLQNKMKKYHLQVMKLLSLNGLG